MPPASHVNNLYSDKCSQCPHKAQWQGKDNCSFLLTELLCVEASVFNQNWTIIDSNTYASKLLENHKSTSNTKQSLVSREQFFVLGFNTQMHGTSSLAYFSFKRPYVNLDGFLLINISQAIVCLFLLSVLCQPSR